MLGAGWERGDRDHLVYRDLRLYRALGGRGMLQAHWASTHGRSKGAGFYTCV